MINNEQFAQEIQSLRAHFEALMTRVLEQVTEQIAEVKTTVAKVEQKQTQLDKDQTEIAARLVKLPPSSPGSPDNSTRSNSNLSQWKVPTINAPTFDGNVKYRPAYEAQTIVDNYLQDTKAKAFVYGFLADGETPRGPGHITYVQWASLGLTDHAANLWRQMPEEKRKDMSWKEYCTWIREKFISGLTFTKAINALMNLKQRTSAAIYSQQFNELVAAVNQACMRDEAFSPDTLCVMYRNGLKPVLAKENRLFDIKDDLYKLQAETERLDDIEYGITPRHDSRDKHRHRHKPEIRRPDYRRDDRPFRDQGSPRDGSSRYHDHRHDQSHDRPNDDVVPMELDNLEKRRLRPLTQEEKDEYDRRGWCKFCQKRDHTFANCSRRKRTSPNDRQNRARNFNVETHSDDGRSEADYESEVRSQGSYAEDDGSQSDSWSEQGY